MFDHIFHGEHETFVTTCETSQSIHYCIIWQTRDIRSCYLKLVICCIRHFLIHTVIIQIMGASGSGKTSLLRAIAGLWAAGTGTITRFLRSESEGVDRVSRPDNSEAIPGDTANHAVNGAVTSSSLDISQEIFFLPQRPYMVLGTLRQQILYPIWTERGFTSPLSPKSNGESHS